MRLNNYLPMFQLLIYNLSKFDFIKHNTGFSSNFLQGYLINFYFFIFKRLPKSKRKTDNNLGFLQKLDRISKSIYFFAGKFIKYSELKKVQLGLGSPFDLNTLKILIIHFFLITVFYMKILFFILFFIFYISYNPHHIRSVLNQIFNRFTKNRKTKVKSNIFTNNDSEQSKTVIVKGD